MFYNSRPNKNARFATRYYFTILGATRTKGHANLSIHPNNVHGILEKTFSFRRHSQASHQDIMSGTSPIAPAPKVKPPLTEDLHYFEAPFREDVLLEVRTGKIQPLHELPVWSGICKDLRNGPVKVSTLGCEGDEHAFRPGDVDKALMHYCSQHYPFWRSEQAQSAHHFTLGSFGENLVSSCANERNICIGDVLSIGEEVLVQVSEPRRPCFKLNHRFHVKNMARLSQDLGRTGWYYRVIRGGNIRQGDQIVLRKRSYPKWTIANVQKYLYHDIRNTGAMQELVEVEPLGKETRTIFVNRLKKNSVESHHHQLTGSEERAVRRWTPYRIVSKSLEARRICSFVLEALEQPQRVYEVEPGSHVRLKFKNGRFQRAYSIVHGDNSRFELGIALETNSRGGSKYLHNTAKVGDVVSVGLITTSFPLAALADHHILIAGGIGITAFVVAATQMHASGESFELHLAVRSADDVPFKRYLEPLGSNIVIHDKSEGQSLDIKQVISTANANTHVYCCGSQRMMDGVASAAELNGHAKENVHYEPFEAETSGEPFTVELAVSNEVIDVPSERTLLDVLRDAGIDMPSSCEVGSCGTCLVNVKKGLIQHRGIGLMDLEKENSMLSCVSRGVGQIVLEL
jgi:MOSC domain-containing protein YiiM/ferredoxin-NADP reductase